MTLDEWIKKYEQEAEEFIKLPGFLTYYEPDKGFFCWAVVGDAFEIDHTCTNDGKWAYNTAYAMAKKRRCKILRTATFRDPAAYMRLFKCTPNLAISGIKPNGKFYWIFEKEVS